jgi:hypothetical protein
VGKTVLYNTQVKSDFFVMMFEQRKESGCVAALLRSEARV